MRGMLIVASVVISLTVVPLVFSDEDGQLDRLDAVNEALQKPLSNEERADLLFEKSRLMFGLFGQLYLRTATEALLKAIQINSQEKYENFLIEIHDQYWRDKNFTGDEQVSKDLFVLQKRCEAAICFAWYNRGLKHMDNPEIQFKNAIEAYPGFAPPYYWLGYYFCKVKRTKESIEYLEKYLQVVDRNDPQESSRIRTAEYFVKEMRSGDIDYDAIMEKLTSKE
jgi:tetratricopeptide (TPR) repeat protein